MHIPAPLAWAVNPAFLWAGLALAAIPIIIHILNRRRYRVVRWAAMEYLLSAMRKNRRRLKFEQWLLLATRCLILALLGLALSRPLGCADSTVAALAGARTGVHVFVIDNSYSMAYEADRPGARTHLDQARMLARQRIRQLSPGGESVIIVTAARQEAAAGRAGAESEPGIVLRSSYDLEAAVAAVDRIEQSYSGTDLAGALQLAARLAREEQRQPHKHLYVLTDFTRSAWETRQADLLRQAGSELSRLFGPRITIHDLGRQGQWNYAVLALGPEGNLVTNKFHTDFVATVRGYGSGGQTLAQWKWDEQLLGDGGRLVPSTDTQDLRQTRAVIREGGAHVLSLTLANDEPLRIDNVRHRVIEVAAELRVLIVEGERGSGMLSGSGAFLDLALAPRKQIGPDGAIRSDSYVAPELISDLELGNRVLGDYRAVIFANVPSIQPAQADQVRRFVEQGGTLMVFMGEQVSTDAYNATLLPRGLLPGRLVARKNAASDASAFTLDFKPDNAHPLLNAFRSYERSGLDTAQIFSYIQLEPAAEAQSQEVLLRYVAGGRQTGDPAILVHTLGQGRVVTVTTTANPDWTTLPAKPAYPALVHELLAGTVSVGDRWLNLLAGQSLRIPPTIRLSGLPVLTDSARRPIPVEAVAQDGVTFYRSSALARPGLYSLNTGNQTFPVAVNVPDDEADIRLLPAEAIRRALGDIEVRFAGDAIPDASLARNDNPDLGWPVMLVLLVFVGLECFMAMRFGHYRRK